MRTSAGALFAFGILLLPVCLITAAYNINAFFSEDQEGQDQISFVRNCDKFPHCWGCLGHKVAQKETVQRALGSEQVWEYCDNEQFRKCWEHDSGSVGEMIQGVLG